MIGQREQFVPRERIHPDETFFERFVAQGVEHAVGGIALVDGAGDRKSHDVGLEAFDGRIHGIGHTRGG